MKEQGVLMGHMLNAMNIEETVNLIQKPNVKLSSMLDQPFLTCQFFQLASKPNALILILLFMKIL